MTQHDDGGPAFPLPESKSGWMQWNDFAEAWIPMPEEKRAGMTLRDYFAAKAMQAWLSLDDNQRNYSQEQVAIISYELADAMLAERNRED